MYDINPLAQFIDTFFVFHMVFSFGELQLLFTYMVFFHFKTKFVCIIYEAHTKTPAYLLLQ